MQNLRHVVLGSMLALSVLAGCAAADPLPDASSAIRPVHFVPSGVYGDFLAGRFALAQFQTGTAADYFLKALDVHPGDRHLEHQAFLAAVLSGRPEAVQLARQLPDDPVAQLVLGDEEARQGHWDAAEQRFRSLPQEGPTALLQPLLVAWSKAGAGQTAAALNMLRPLVEGRSFRAIFALHAGMIADLGGFRPEANAFFTIAQGSMPQLNLRAAQVIASWDARAGRAAAAEQVFATLADDAPDLAIAAPALETGSATPAVTRATDGMAEAYLALGGAMQAQDSPEYAMLMLRLALDLRPDLTAARLLTANLLDDDHRPDAALRMLAAVPANDPLAAVVRMRRAGILAQMGRSRQALHELASLSKDFPDSPLPDIQRADILRAGGRYPAAIAAYSAGIGKLGHLRADDWPIFYDRGIAYSHANDWPKAEADFRHALQLSPDQPYVLNYLGYSWADKGEHLRQARRMIEMASDRRPDDGAIVDSLGWVLLRQGDVKDAVQELQRAVELEPEDPTINGHLGDAYAAAGRLLEAQYQWRRALTLNPDPADSAKLEAKLQAPPAAAMASGK